MRQSLARLGELPPSILRDWPSGNAPPPPNKNISYETSNRPTNQQTTTRSTICGSNGPHPRYFSRCREKPSHYLQAYLTYLPVEHVKGGVVTPESHSLAVGSSPSSPWVAQRKCEACDWRRPRAGLHRPVHGEPTIKGDGAPVDDSDGRVGPRFMSYGYPEYSEGLA